MTRDGRVNYYACIACLVFRPVCRTMIHVKILDLRAQLFNQIRDPNVVLRFYTVRDAVGENTNYEFDQPVLQQIYNKWRAQGLRIFTNNYYIVLSVGGANARDKLNQYGNYIESVLAAYRPRVLRNDSPGQYGAIFWTHLIAYYKTGTRRM